MYFLIMCVRDSYIFTERIHKTFDVKKLWELFSWGKNVISAVKPCNYCKRKLCYPHKKDILRIRRNFLTPKSFLLKFLLDWKSKSPIFTYVNVQLWVGPQSRYFKYNYFRTSQIYCCIQLRFIKTHEFFLINKGREFITKNKREIIFKILTNLI